MGQRLRDWYRYLEQQMHVSLPGEPVEPRPGNGHGVGSPRHRPLGASAVYEPPESATAAARLPAEALRAGAGPRAALLGVGPPRGLDPRRRGGRRPITETREQIIRRLLDPELTLHEAAAVLNLSKATVRRYTDQGKLSCLRTHGGQRRFRLSALLEFLDRQEPQGET